MVSRVLDVFNVRNLPILLAVDALNSGRAGLVLGNLLGAALV